METFKTRLVAEQTELKEKYDKLTEFIDKNPTFGKLSKSRQALLICQHNFMLGYLDCLSLRLQECQDD